jgi:hypothetical protein
MLGKAGVRDPLVILSDSVTLSLSKGEPQSVAWRGAYAVGLGQ